MHYLFGMTDVDVQMIMIIRFPIPKLFLQRQNE